MIIKTQGIRYAGSKKTILPEILSLIPKECKNILDAFSGTTRLGQALKLMGYNIHSNDIQEYSKVFGECYLLNNKPKESYIEIINHLNNISPIHGWFSQNYGSNDDYGKKPWRLDNTTKLDAIIQEIHNLNLDEVTRSICLTSLILGLDKVDNTLGHQVAYLKGWSKRSYNNLLLEVPELISGDKEYKVTKDNIFNINNSFDLVYFDPPYGTNNIKHLTTRVRYSSYYHIWNTICKNDKPEIFGKCNRRSDSSDKLGVSEFENTNYDSVFNDIKRLCESINCKYFIFSYNNKSKVKIQDIREYFNIKFKIITEKSFKYKENIQKSLTINKEYIGDISENFEFLFLVTK